MIEGSGPFAEPSDSEGTVIRPRPSGAATARVDVGSLPMPRDSAAAQVPRTGTNALVAAAAPVLEAAMRIGATRGGPPPDVDRLHRAMVAAIKRFETDALATGLDTRTLRAARYALCATVDDL